MPTILPRDTLKAVTVGGYQPKGPPLDPLKLKPPHGGSAIQSIPKTTIIEVRYVKS